MLSVIASSTLSLIAVAVGASITFLATRSRERESDWRRIRFQAYQELVIAISGITGSRSGNATAQERFADAVNSMWLVAPTEVLGSLVTYRDGISVRNPERAEEHDQLLNDPIYAMRQDISSGQLRDDNYLGISLWAPY